MNVSASSIDENQVLFAKYVHAAALAMWIWDYISTLDEEVAILRLRNCSASVPYLVYCTSRLLSLLNLVLTIMLGAHHFTRCKLIIVLTTFAASLSVAFSTLLMCIRVLAVYQRSHCVKVIFRILLLCVFGAALAEPFAVLANLVTGQCVAPSADTFGTAGILGVATTAIDALIFLAITYQILKWHAIGDRWQDKAKGFFRGEGLFKMSKLLLQTGQLYYAATVGINILAVAAVMSSTFPAVLRLSFTSPSIAITNCMACKVFRLTQLGLLNDDPTSAFSTGRLCELAFDPVSGSSGRGETA